MIFLDTETTGLLKPKAANLKEQPKITEICMIKHDGEKKETVFHTLINPQEKLDDIIIQLTGITDSMLVNAPTFAEIYDDLCDFVLCEKTIIAHNAPFDMGMLYVELARLDREFHFPWPKDWVCTMEKSKHITGKFLKLTELHEKATGRPHNEKAHRATEDVQALIRCYDWLCEKGFQ